MSEQDVSLRRVIFELPNEHVPELMSTLSDFVLEHNISLALDDADPSATEPSLVEEKPLYNPDMVSWIKDPESDEEIAVIYRENLQAFATERDGHPMAGTRFYNAILRGPYWVSKENGPPWAGMMVADADNVRAIRADRARQLEKGLQARTLIFQGVRKGTIGFFSDFCEKMLLGDEQSG